VTSPSPPDPDRGARFLKKLLEDDPAHLDVATDDEVERMMDAAGIQVKSVPTADELIALADKRAREQAPAPAPPPRSRARRMSPVAFAAVLVLGAGGIVALLNSAAIVAYLKGEPIGPDRPWSPPTARPSPQELAAAMRTEAFAACDAQKWEECTRKLDDASAIDPAGEADPRVTAARTAVTDGMKNHEIKRQPKRGP
jgi:hypothetical protein